jgi:predicted membrane protein
LCRDETIVRLFLSLLIYILDQWYEKKDYNNNMSVLNAVHPDLVINMIACTPIYGHNYRPKISFNKYILFEFQINIKRKIITGWKFENSDPYSIQLNKTQIQRLWFKKLIHKRIIISKISLSWMWFKSSTFFYYYVKEKKKKNELNTRF